MSAPLVTIVTVPPLALVASNAEISKVSPSSSESLLVTLPATLICGPVWAVALPTSSSVLPTALKASLLARGLALIVPGTSVTPLSSCSNCTPVRISPAFEVLVIVTEKVRVSPGSATPSPSVSTVSSADSFAVTLIAMRFPPVP